MISRVAVVGAGVMGADIAQVVSAGGYPVALKDVDPAMLEQGMERIRAFYQRRVERRRLKPAEAKEKMALITPTLRYDELAEADLVIEAVPERMELKKQVFRELDQVTRREAILASNTSALSISEMASATSRPERVVGTHFFYPVPIMRLVEVIAGQETSEGTVEEVMAFVSELRKLPVRVKECPGFLVNRILLASLLQALRFQQETGLPYAAVDKVLQERAGVPMGPFALADAIGLDVILDVCRTMEKLGSRFALPAYLEEMVRAGKRGQKAGQGFYSYPVSGGEEAPGMGEEQARQLADRFLLAGLVEACRLLEEGVAAARDIDTAMRAGAGYARGPLSWADEVGLDTVLEKLEKLAPVCGEAFAVPPSLRALVSRGELGKKTGQGFLAHP